MTKYFTKNYRRNRKVSSADVIIDRAGFGEEEYIKNYGESSLPSNGLERDSLILRLKLSDFSVTLINLNGDSIQRIKEELKIDDSKKLKGIELKALIQEDRVVGINKE